MGIRFHRRIKILPGVHLNFSRSGVSASIGRRGASVTVGPRGRYVNLGLPGTGISYRTKLPEHHEAQPQHKESPELAWAGCLVILAFIGLLLMFVLRS
jgi:hypothetical protein